MGAKGPRSNTILSFVFIDWPIVSTHMVPAAPDPARLGPGLAPRPTVDRSVAPSTSVVRPAAGNLV